VQAFGDTVQAVRVRTIAHKIELEELNPDHPRWNPIADVTGDGKVDITDIAIIARQFGWIDP
jgi:hypothetical protein